MRPTVASKLIALRKNMLVAKIATMRRKQFNDE